MSPKKERDENNVHQKTPLARPLQFCGALETVPTSPGQEHLYNTTKTNAKAHLLPVPCSFAALGVDGAFSKLTPEAVEAVRAANHELLVRIRIRVSYSYDRGTILLETSS